MTRPLHLGIQVIGLGTLDVRRPGNVQGDELVARCWQKYLVRQPGVASVQLYGPGAAPPTSVDAVVHFHPELPLHPAAKNVLYLQNAFPREMFAGGTEGVFSRVRDRFDGFLFTSERLLRACARRKPGGGSGSERERASARGDCGPDPTLAAAVVPFATDPELFAPVAGDEREWPAVTFVGNNIRGERCNQRYLEPALPFGLALYGNNSWEPPLAGVCRGKIPMEDLAALYGGSRVNLNAHIREHVELDTVNQRLYDILACGGFALSDALDGLEAVFEDAVMTSDGDEDLWAALTVALADGAERRRRAALGRRLVLDRHTYAHRAATVVGFLREVM